MDDLSDPRLDKVGGLLADRKHAEARRLLEPLETRLKEQDPLGSFTPRFLDYAGRLADSRYHEIQPLFQHVVSTIPQSCALDFPLRDSFHLQLAQGTSALLKGDYEESLRHWDRVLSHERLVDPVDFIAVAAYNRGRALRKLGRYEQALRDTETAKEVTAKKPQLNAFIEVQEAWIRFARGDALSSITDLLARCGKAMSAADDLGHASRLSVLLRLLRRQGRYTEAIRTGDEVLEYLKGPEFQNHRHRARILVQLAFTYYLLASADRRRGRGEQSTRSAQNHLEKADDHLKQASAIYKECPHPKGLGVLNLCRAHVLLQSGYATRAMGLAEQVASDAGSRDPVLKTRAFILKCMIAWYAPREAKPYADPAQVLEWGTSALEAANDTESPRLRARAETWAGCAHLLADREPAQWHEAHGHWKEASRLLGDAVKRDYVSEEVVALRRALDSDIAQSIEALIKSAHGNRPMKSLQKEFSRLVILSARREWTGQGGEKPTYARMADRLHVSPREIAEALESEVPDDNPGE